MKQDVILTGLRANNDLTLGNYFGGILPMVDMAKTRSSEFQINMFIPDLHSFTTPIDHSQLYEQILHNARVFAAAGLPLENENIYLYRQSYVPAHSELTWILDCFTGFGEMSRMTQFKDKSSVADVEKEEFNHMKAEAEKISALLEDYPEGRSFAGQEAYRMTRDSLLESHKRLWFYIRREELMSKVKVGLFNYPVLMAADILLYGAKYIPVGDDQTQHLEFTRDIAERMNSRFGDLFIIPEPVKKQHEFFGKDQGLRIMDLADPTKKMSKSDELGKGVIFLSDTPDVAAKKVMSATTDDKAHVRFDRQNQPGISNLLEILALLRGASLEQITEEFEGQERYGDFKKVVANELAAFLTNFQQNLVSVDNAVVQAKLESSEAAMNEQANATLLRVQQAVGLRPRG